MPSILSHCCNAPLWSRDENKKPKSNWECSKCGKEAYIKNKDCDCAGQDWNGKEWIGDHFVGCPEYK